MKKRLRSNAARRDLWTRGVRVDEGRLEISEVLEDFTLCPHCLRSVCVCVGGVRSRYATYSTADYTPYQLSEDDLIACIDILNHVFPRRSRP